MVISTPYWTSRIRLIVWTRYNSPLQNIKDYTEIPGKGMNISLDISTKSPNNKQKEGFDIAEITKQDFRKLFKKFNNPPCIGYNSKQVHNEPNGA